MQHIEQHFSGSETGRDGVIGMADGVTVPFALAAGIAGALTSTHIVVAAGLAEIAASSIAMGLGGYLVGQEVTPSTSSTSDGANNKRSWKKRTSKSRKP
jgi:alanine dehydrogenase